ncbi:MAG: hydrolase [Myxococcota bacterium]
MNTNKTATLFLTALAIASSPAVAQTARPTAAKSLLTPDNHSLILIDHQSQMAFATNSIDIVALRNNVTGLAKAAQAFNVPTILTTVAEKTFSGPVFPELAAVLEGADSIDRTTMNSWEDKRITDRVNKIGKKKIVMAALWTEVCGVDAALSAVEQGFEVYFITDASGGVSDEAHDRAMQRMVQAGVVPMTWLQYLLELQRDWARSKTYEATNAIAKQHGGGYGLGIIYAKEMFGAQEGK